MAKKAQQKTTYHVYEWDGTYIQGNLLGTYTTEGRMKKTVKKIHPRAVLVPDVIIGKVNPNTIWIEDPDGDPIGVIEVEFEK